jgi:hypothetical protein
MRKHWIGKALKILLFVVVASFVLGFVVESLWNWLMPPIFGMHVITFWQGLGLLLLGKILFGGFRGFRGHGDPRWRHRMNERWAAMSPEERERFRQGMKRRCGGGRWEPPAEPTTTPRTAEESAR